MERLEFDSTGWEELVAGLGGAEALERSGRDTKAFVRARGVRSAIDLLRLALMYGPGGASLRVLAATAAELGVADVSDVALMKRIRGAADWLEFLCREQMARAAAAPAGVRLRVVDSSRIAGPGKTAWRLHLAYDPYAERSLAAAVTPAGVGERFDRPASSGRGGGEPGEIHVADRGYPQPDGLAAVRRDGGHVLVRVTWNSLKLTDEHARPLDWPALCRAAAADGPQDVAVQVTKPRGRFEPLALRLAIIPKPREAAARARAAALRENARNPPRRLDPRTLACADHLMLLTSLDEAAAPATELAALYRRRWRIELAFKRMKSLIRIDRLPARDPELARAWLYACLLATLMTENALADSEAFSP